MFRIFSKYTNKVVVGRFDIHTTESHKMIKATLANSDNCGDIICGNPKEVKELIDDGGDNKYNFIHGKNKNENKNNSAITTGNHSWHWYYGKQS